MQATKTLPPEFEAKGTLDLSKNKVVWVALNVLALGVLWAASWFFLWAAAHLRADMTWLIDLMPAGGVAGLIAALVVETVVIVVLHEATHGLFFWLFSRERPRFGLRGSYAYASAPDWYFPRRQFVLIGLAPLVLLSLAGLVLMLLVPPQWMTYLLLFLIFNASGATGDLITIIWLLTRPAGIWVQDQGDVITWWGSSTS